MCGVAPKQIGATVWEEHPTLRALIKMVISSRYRFPTVDCGETDRSEMKKQEQQMRDMVWKCFHCSFASISHSLTSFPLCCLRKESKIAETLFLPQKPEPPKEFDAGTPSHGRSRMSARQQQKRERTQRRKREKEAAEALIGKTEMFRCSFNSLF
jgi:hypothetical protein